MTPEIQELLRLAAVREHRKHSNMIEGLILAYCQLYGIEIGTRSPKKRVREPRSKVN